MIELDIDEEKACNPIPLDIANIVVRELEQRRFDTERVRLHSRFLVSWFNNTNYLNEDGETIRAKPYELFKTFLGDRGYEGREFSFFGDENYVYFNVRKNETSSDSREPQYL